MPTESPPRILLVEDDITIVSLLQFGLTHEGFEVTTATTGPDGFQAAVRQPPDLAIFDWMLPGIDGLELCRRFRKINDAPVIMLTVRDAVDDRVTGLAVGADDYVTKPFDFSELLARIRAHLRRHLPTRDTLSFADLSLDPGTREVRRAAQPIHLTATEFNLLLLFMRQPRQVIAKQDILDAVWGYDFGGIANIVEQYVRTLRQKLGAPRLIHTVRQVGYVLREDETQR
jgi:DNA-binding response OmpR family regulator